jgi:putative endopeptidase
MMKKNLLWLAAAALTLGACSPKTGTTSGTTSAPKGKDLVTPAGERPFIDAKNMNLGVSPADDFYEYANGNWLKTTTIPASESRWGSFNELIDFNRNALKTICESAAAKVKTSTGIDQKVGAMYASGMDSLAIEKAGISVLKPNLDRIAGMKGYTDLLREIGTLYTEGSDPLWGLVIDQDDKNSTAIVPKFYQGGLHLPDRDFYIKDDERSVKIRKSFEEHVFNVFKLLGDTDAKAKSATADVIKMETAFAKASMTRVERRDPKKTYHKMTVTDLEAICPQMNWADYLKNCNLNSSYVVVGQPEFLKEMNSQLKNTQLEDWKNFLRFGVVKSAMPFLSKAFVDENFKFSQVFSGQKEMQPRWKRVSGITDGMLGEALGQMYVAQNFKPEAKTRMLTLVDNLAKTYEKRIKELDWMSAETKTKALQKLSTFIRKIGYPDRWKDYTKLTVSSKNSYFENIQAGRKFLYQELTARIGKPVDKGLWLLSPPTVNAYYNPSMNEIVFPAGILQYPFFDDKADDAVNYGGIGAVIGHEMTHGFDDEGRQFDAQGNLADWWTEEDAKKFDVKAKVLVDQFNKYVVLDTVSVNGQLTLGENLADLGGLSLAYEAFKTYSPQGRSLDRIDGFTPEQRFFLAWAQVWRGNMRDEAMAQRIVTDPHAPEKYRTNGPLSNLPEFYQAFGVKQGNKLWRPEAERAKVW